MKGEFFGWLDLQYIDGRSWKVENKYSATQFGFSLSDGRIIVPPDGMITDFASIPRFLWRVMPPTGDGSRARYGLGAVIHDCIYQSGRVDGVIVERVEADAIFKVCNEAVECEPWRITTMDWGLRVGGGAAWDNYRRKAQWAR